VQTTDQVTLELSLRQCIDGERHQDVDAGVANHTQVAIQLSV
jgi:hypothetical protein